MINFLLQKWYFDLIAADGHCLYLYFVATKLAGIRQGQVSAHLMLPDGRVVQSLCHVKPATNGKGEGVVFGESSLLTAQKISRVIIRLPSLSVDLDYTSIGAPWVPGGDGLLINGRNYLSWHVPHAKAAVKGRLRAGSIDVRVSGLGYHDFVEMTIPPWRLPVAELLWGRAHCGPFSVVYDQIRTRDNGYLRHILLHEAEQPTASAFCQESFGKTQKVVQCSEFQIESDALDRETTVVHDAFTLQLSRRRILEEGSLATDERIKPKLLKHFLIRTAGDVWQLKMLSDATLHVGDTTVQGLAIHERVSWNREGER